MKGIEHELGWEGGGGDRIVLAGGSGFIGRALAERLERRGYRVVVLTRRPDEHRGPGRPVGWDGRTVEDGWASELEGARALVNLAGAPAGRRPHGRRRDEALRSRIEPTEALGEALRLVYRVPEVWVQASSLAIYGRAGDRLCDETAHVPGGHPSELWIAGEEALGWAVRPEMRWVTCRIGCVLGGDGGALPALARLVRGGLGGDFGDAGQWLSWIHIEDVARLFVEAIENPDVRGICNATGLQPVTASEFTATLRRVLGAPFGLPAPLRLVNGASIRLDSGPDREPFGRRALPCRVHGLGFRFRHHELEDALSDLLVSPGAPETAGAERWAGASAHPAQQG